MIVKVGLWLVAVFVALLGLVPLFDYPPSGVLVIASAYLISPISPLPSFFGKIAAERSGAVSQFSLKALAYVVPVVFFVTGVGFSAVNKPTKTIDATTANDAKTPAVPAAVPISIQKSAPETRAKPALRDKIADYIFTPYTKAQYPKSFAKFGARMPDVERARQAAAFLAATSEKCAKVDGSELSDASTKSNIKIFIDCTNPAQKYERFLFEESELKDKKGKFYTEKTATTGEKPATVADRAMSEEIALMVCRETVLKSAKFPSSVNFKTFGQNANTSKTSGETWVEVEFEAKNPLGGILLYKANCGFPIHGEPTFSISNR